jgi:uncharacterized RDD family membrane protein YckC
MLAPVAACGVCDAPTPYDWERCGSCGAQRLLDADGAYAGHRRLAALRRRALALLVDAIVLGVPIALALLVPRRFAEPGRDSSESLALVVVLAAAIYPTVALGASGRTIGKRLLRIHVVTSEGAPLSYPRAGVREGFGKILLAALLAGGIGAFARLAGDGSERLGLYYLALVPIGLVLAATVSAAFDERRQALHDKAARTIVVQGAPVRVSRTAAPAPSAPEPPGARGAHGPAT